MLIDVIHLLRCPLCHAPLTLTAGVVACPQGHRFDVARLGYVNLLPGDAGSGTADTAAMVDARVRFLQAGHFAPLSAAVVDVAQRHVGSGAAVVDIGAGPGHHLAAVLDARPTSVGLALDLSKHAMRRAARCHPRAGAAVCDTWRGLPVATDRVDVLLDVFAPRNGAEMSRVLAADGVAIVVTPTTRHLHELRSAVALLQVPADKPVRVRDTLAPYLRPRDHREVEFPMTLSHDDVVALLAMGPTAHHVSADDIARDVARLPDALRVTASVAVSVHEPAPSPAV